MVSLWIIEPAVSADDESWQDRTVWAEIIVAATSPAFARLAADKGLIQEKSTHVGNESESRRSGLNDSHFYHVRELPAERRKDFGYGVAAGDILLARGITARAAPASLGWAFPSVREPRRCVRRINAFLSQPIVSNFWPPWALQENWRGEGRMGRLWSNVRRRCHRSVPPLRADGRQERPGSLRRGRKRIRFEEAGGITIFLKAGDHFHSSRL